MKKIFMAGLIALSATAVHAQYVGPYAAAAASTVKQLQETGRDDQRVVLRGRITGVIGKERYQFSDDTGEIPVKIDRRYWPAGQPVSESTQVELLGKYDKEYFGPSKVKVYGVRLIP